MVRGVCSVSEMLAMGRLIDMTLNVHSRSLTMTLSDRSRILVSEFCPVRCAGEEFHESVNIR